MEFLPHFIALARLTARILLYLQEEIARAYYVRKISPHILIGDLEFGNARESSTAVSVKRNKKFRDGPDLTFMKSF